LTSSFTFFRFSYLKIHMNTWNCKFPEFSPFVNLFIYLFFTNALTYTLVV
jgi:hypothetical protein